MLSKESYQIHIKPLILDPLAKVIMSNKVQLFYHNPEIRKILNQQRIRAHGPLIHELIQEQIDHVSPYFFLLFHSILIVHVTKNFIIPKSVKIAINKHKSLLDIWNV